MSVGRSATPYSPMSYDELADEIFAMCLTRKTMIEERKMQVSLLNHLYLEEEKSFHVELQIEDLDKKIKCISDDISEARRELCIKGGIVPEDQFLKWHSGDKPKPKTKGKKPAEPEVKQEHKPFDKKAARREAQEKISKLIDKKFRRGR